MKLVQVRECDGKCCEEKPRWPYFGTCLYLKDGKCGIKAGTSELDLDLESPSWPGRNPAEVFKETCDEWPQNSHEGRDTGGCCWQWVADGD
jgi:hypothetical protein